MCAIFSWNIKPSCSFSKVSTRYSAIAIVIINFIGRSC
ncbi:hypothetical protein [Flagellimonas sp.]